MRLLYHSATGEFSITKDLVDDDPILPYAILSHTWGQDTEEVTFEDMTNNGDKDKLGYEKIRFCREQAKQDRLQHFWIDTFGLILAVLIEKITPNSRALSTPCFAGTATQLDATHTCLMSRQQRGKGVGVQKTLWNRI